MAKFMLLLFALWAAFIVADPSDPDDSDNEGNAIVQVSTLLGKKYNCTAPPGSVEGWAYRVPHTVQNQICTTKAANSNQRWTMLNSYRSGGTSGYEYKYTNNENDSDCLKDWKYYASDGTTLIAHIKGRLTKINDSKNWCATKVYRPGGKRGYQWDYCTCDDRPPPPPPETAPPPWTPQPCVKPANSVTNWSYEARKNGPYNCTTEHDSQNKWFTMLNAYRSGGKEKWNWKYTNDVNDPECLVDWTYYDKNGQTNIVDIQGRLTTLGDKKKKNWCALPVYRPGGKEGFQWARCDCAL